MKDFPSFLVSHFFPRKRQRNKNISLRPYSHETFRHTILRWRDVTFYNIFKLSFNVHNCPKIIFSIHAGKNIGWKMSFYIFFKHYLIIFLSQYCAPKYCVWIWPKRKIKKFRAFLYQTMASLEKRTASLSIQISTTRMRRNCFPHFSFLKFE